MRGRKEESERRRTRSRRLSIGSFRIVDWDELIFPLLSKEESSPESKESEMIGSEARRETLKDENEKENGQLQGRRRKRKRTR